MNRPTAEQDETRLQNAGNSPARFGFFLRPIRRAFWLVARPFHLNQQVQIEALQIQADELRALLNRGITVANTSDGLLLVKRGDVVSEAILSGRFWDEHVLQAASEAASQRNSLAIDIGAHVGLFTLAFGQRFSRVMSFEPNGFNFNLLRANVALNGLSNVTTFRHALFSRTVNLSLSFDERQDAPVTVDQRGQFDGLAATNLGAYSFDEQGTGLFENEARPLDSYKLEDVAFIKVDVQGADGEVIMGAAETIERCRPVVVFEWEKKLADNFGVTFDDVLALFARLNYQVSTLRDHTPDRADYVARPAV